MELRKCFDILEVRQNGTMEEVRQAYKDLVKVWHPDRFAEDPRLRVRAEKRLKEINTAYETVKAFLLSCRHRSSGQSDAPEGGKAGFGDGGEEGGEHRRGADVQDKTEAAFEAGTFMVLNTWANVSTALRRMVREAVRTGDERKESGDSAKKSG